ncbi:MAG: hypothetical protein VYD19_11370 [Myxococcota bacterium]|nr:hypothetical protein [Myxococcota bacterium]
MSRPVKAIYALALLGLTGSLMASSLLWYGPRLESAYQLRRQEHDQLLEKKQRLLTEVYLLKMELAELKAGGEEGIIHAQTQLGLLRNGERLYRFSEGERTP